MRGLITDRPMSPEFTDDQIKRYARQIILPEIGPQGQQNISKARVLCLGMGGLGSPAALYLAAAGVGMLGLADNDTVDVSNLQRQIIHSAADVGRAKVASAERRLSALNPEVPLRLHSERLGPQNVFDIIAGYDLVLDGSDNFDTRYLLNEACVQKNVPLISGAILRWEGQITTILPKEGHCYRCLFPDPPSAEEAQSCAQAGILGPVAGVIGSLQAIEAVKIILKLPGNLANRLLIFDFKSMSLRDISVRRNLECPVCGTGPRPPADSGGKPSSFFDTLPEVISRFFDFRSEKK